MTAEKIYLLLLIFSIGMWGSTQDSGKLPGDQQEKSALRETRVFTEYADSVFGQTFENRPRDSEYHEDDMVSDFSIGNVKPEGYSVGLGTYDGDSEWKKEELIGTYNVDIVDVPALQNGVGGKTRCLRINHKQGKYGLLGVNPGGGGAKWLARIPPGYQELYLSYNIMRDENAEPLREAKIPHFTAGFTWSENNVGVRALAIMNRQEEFQQRWLIQTQEEYKREWGSYWFNPDTGVRWKWDWSDSTWYNITYRLSLNDNGQRNGILEAFVNGKLVGNMNGEPMVAGDVDIDRIVFVWFHGGATTDYILNDDAILHVDDIYLFTYKEGYAPGPREASEHGRVLYGLPNWDIELGKKLEPGDAEMYDDTPPTQPGNLKATNTTQYSIDIKWDASEDFAGVRSYYIFVNNERVFETDLTSFHISGLDAGTEYEISVQAVDISGNVSLMSNVIKETTESEDVAPRPPPDLTDDTIAPTAPANLEVRSVSDKTVHLSWDPSSDDYGIYYYVIYIDGKEFLTTPDTFMTIGFLQPDADPLQALVRAYDINGNLSPPSNIVSFVVDAADTESPTAPQNLRSTYVSENAISLEWDASSDNQGVREYLIYANDKFWESSSRTEETLAYLEPGLPYKLFVTAVDDAGNSSEGSNIIEVTTKNGDETINPTLPDISIIDIQDKVHIPKVTSEMSSLGFIELENFGLEVIDNNNPSGGSMILNGLGSTNVINPNRVNRGLQAFYNFTEGEQSHIVMDLSGKPSPLDMYIDREGLATEWLPGQGLRIQDETSLSYQGKESRLMDSLRSTNEITIEVWLKQESLHQLSEAHLFSLAGSGDSLAASLSQVGNQVYYNYSVKLSTDDNPLGQPALNTGYNFSSLSLHHVVYTRKASGEEKIYINGIELALGNRSGDFSTWDDNYRLVFCNHPDGNKNWKGILYMLAIYNRALSQEEVSQNFNSTSGKIQFTNELSQLSNNVEYTLTPFISSSQGLVYGNSEIFLRKSIAKADSLFFSFYPNPSSGGINLVIRNIEENVTSGILRIANHAGTSYYLEEIQFSDLLVQEKFIMLPPDLPEGEYIISLIGGNQTFSNTLIINRH